jgi:hypothetical protein
MSSQNYARGVPMGNNQIPFQGNGTPPAVKAIVSRVSENAVASSVITMSMNTTAIEIAATGTAVLMRWVPVTSTDPSVFGNASVMNYDHVIPANTYRRFVVPIEVNNPQGYGSQVGANIENGLFRRFAWASPVAASVYSTEYGSSNFY